MVVRVSSSASNHPCSFSPLTSFTQVIYGILGIPAQDHLMLSKNVTVRAFAGRGGLILLRYVWLAHAPPGSYSFNSSSRETGLPRCNFAEDAACMHASLFSCSTAMLAIATLPGVLIYQPHYAARTLHHAPSCPNRKKNRCGLQRLGQRGTPPPLPATWPHTWTPT